MSRMRKTVVLLLAVIIPAGLVAQTDLGKKQARTIAMKAIEMMDNGQVDKSIELLNESCRLDPDNATYPYELGYAYYIKEDYSKAIGIYEVLVGRSDITDQCYQMLGNAYDMSNQREKALETYHKGLKKFPQSGRLYLELGNIERTGNNMDKAIAVYEQGIRAEPGFPSNYYWAARIFLSSENELWGMIYGEIFMNLERGSDRTAEISKLLFDTYASQISITSDTAFLISFCKSTVMGRDNKHTLPFSLVYEPALSFAVISEDTITLESLNRIRYRFIVFYEERGFFKSQPNVLFEWHKKLIGEQWFESYNYWLLMQGSYDEFAFWYSHNQSKFDAFIKWFENNPMPVNEKNVFLRIND
jgi:tetratricopeptide (TPR) repeat protein